MKVFGSYAGRVWRRKSTVLGAATGATLLVLCLQYGSSRQVDSGQAVGGQAVGGQVVSGQLFDQQPQQQSVSAAVVAAENSVHFVANNHQPTNYPNGAGDAGFQNQDLLDNNNAGNQRLDDVNNLLLGGQGGGVGLMDSLDDHAGSSNGGGSRSIYVPGQRLMHFDLKGAPPRVSYLKRMMPLAKELGATGVLIEWEDMFPWAGRLAPLAAGNAYSRQDVQEIIDAAVSNGLEVIPLVQTFGHVEFALKHSEFSELREVPESPQALCPSLNTSHDFVHQMIEQVMDMHKNIRYLHIGCDEVFQMGECVRCRSQPRDTLFLQHVTRVAQFVRTRHPGVTPIIWDDMLRHLPPISLEQYRIGELVEPMVWVYAEDVYRFVPSSVWDKYAAVFARVWAASAFKGAFGETLQVPNAKRHLDNNMRWLQVMQTEAPKFSGGFQGIAITGWQRYDHFAVLCELLPSAIPSLAVTLLATSHGYFNQSLRPKLNSALSCGVFVGNSLDNRGSSSSGSFLSLNNDPFLFEQFSRCVFPGHAFFRLLYRLSTVEREVAEAVASIRKDKGWMTDYNVRHNFSSPLRVDELTVDHQRLYHSVTSLVRGAKDALWEIFDAYTVAEWIEQRIYPMVQQLESISRDSISLKTPRVWPRRPFPILNDLHRLGLQFSTDSSPG
ncbi:hexosaminidase D isoform X2 [Nilaparvata lugens]|uniref:hexosaminidase D isoform X2 n=1 Tax=Nilaparvata lugens TaxID=108931 RepID=UPI00193DF085|nr:hexosaminidase D isoform X2 [Nilaparvata lugens]